MITLDELQVCPIEFNVIRLGVVLISSSLAVTEVSYFPLSSTIYSITAFLMRDNSLVSVSPTNMQVDLSHARIIGKPANLEMLLPLDSQLASRSLEEIGFLADSIIVITENDIMLADMHILSHQNSFEYDEGEAMLNDETELLDKNYLLSNLEQGKEVLFLKPNKHLRTNIS